MPRRLWLLPARDLSFLVFLAAVVLSLLRARDLPGVDLGVGGADVSVGPVDVALVATAVLAAWRLRERRRVPSMPLVLAAGVFALLVFVSALPNGADALTSAGRLAELYALTLGAVAFLGTREHLAALLAVVVGFCVVAVGWGAIEFVTGGGGRQGSFMGEHDLAALGTLALVVGLAVVYAWPGRPGAVALAGIVAGGLAVSLGASLASLLGLYLAAAALVALALVRRAVRRAALLTTAVVVVAVTAMTVTLRSGELGFLQEWFGPEAETPGQYAASWSQRLIFTYVGGRVFLESPVLGTGWYGELPEHEYIRFLPDARRRFPDQPDHYFGDLEGTYIPQQAYDQVLIELGIVGGLVFLVVAVLAVRYALRAGLRASPEPRLVEHALVPGGWVAGMAGALAGAALFGGSPLSSLFWLTVGVVAAIPPLVVPRS
jgi:O-Antigen ligase